MEGYRGSGTKQSNAKCVAILHYKLFPLSQNQSFSSAQPKNHVSVNQAAAQKQHFHTTTIKPSSEVFIVE